MFGFTGVAKWVAIAVIVTMAGSAVIWVVSSIQNSERAKIEAERAQSAADAERERIKDDAIVRNLSDYELCTRHLNRGGVRIDDACGALLGVPPEQP